MSHTSQRALFSPSAEKTQAAKEYLFYLMITPSARHSLKQSQLHVRRQTLLPRGEKSYLHSRRPLAALFLPRSESLGRDILRETRERHSVTHPNGGFNNLKPARSSISKKAWKKGSLHAILMLLQKCRQNDKQRKRMKFLVFGFRREDAAIRGAQILLQGFNYRQVIKPVVVFFVPVAYSTGLFGRHRAALSQFQTANESSDSFRWKIILLILLQWITNGEEK